MCVYVACVCMWCVRDGVCFVVHCGVCVWKQPHPASRACWHPRLTPTLRAVLPQRSPCSSLRPKVLVERHTHHLSLSHTQQPHCSCHYVVPRARRKSLPAKRLYLLVVARMRREGHVLAPFPACIADKVEIIDECDTGALSFLGKEKGGRADDSVGTLSTMTISF